MSVDNQFTDELAELVGYHIAGLATDEQFARLRSLLEASEEAREFYVDTMDIHFQLYWKGRLQQEASEMSQGAPAWDSAASPTENIDDLEDDSIYGIAEEPPPVPVPFLPGPTYTLTFVEDASASITEESLLARWCRLTYFATAAFLSLAVMAGLLTNLIYYPVEDAASPLAERVVGRISDEVGCQWTDSLSSVLVGDTVSVGRKLSIRSGILEITYDTGSKVILQGPADYEVRSSNSGFLSLGKLTGRVTTQRAKGFTVNTPTACVIDLGTEFGIEVDESQQTTSHVFQGSVKLLATPTSGESMAIVMKQNESARVERRSDRKAPVVIVPCGVARPERFVREEQLSPFGRWQAYSQALPHDPTLLVYYDFEKRPGSPAALANAAQGSDGSRDGEIKNATWTAGRLKGKQALEFNGPDNRVELRVPEEVRDLTLTVWVCVHSLAEEPSGLLMSDANEHGCLHWELTRDGRMCCDFLGKGGEEGLRTHNLSPPLFDRKRLGRWTHLAVVYERTTGNMAFYCDGQRVSTVKVEMENDAAIRIGAASIGCWMRQGGPQPHGIRRLHGRIDELAVFARPLTPDNIRRMFEAGRGKGTENR